jgi:hypothetical protein
MKLGGEISIAARRIGEQPGKQRAAGFVQGVEGPSYPLALAHGIERTLDLIEMGWILALPVVLVGNTRPAPFSPSDA